MLTHRRKARKGQLGPRTCERKIATRIGDAIVIRILADSILELTTKNLKLKTVSRDAPPDRRRDDAQFTHELRELAGLERLRAVGKRMVGIVVYFD